MTCYCNSLKLKECSCKLFGYPVKGNPAPFFVENLSQIGQVERTDCFRQSLENGKLYRILELLYDKCAAYNLRYCPLKKAVDQDKYIINAVKDLAILTCFLVANLIVFVIILARTVLHIFAVFKVTGHGIRKYLTTVSSESSTSFNFANTGTLDKHDFSPPRG